MSIRRRLAAVTVAAATATSLATAPAMAAENQGSIEQIQGSISVGATLSSAPIFLGINKALGSDDEQAGAGARLSAVSVGIIAPIAVTIAVGVAAYNFAVQQGWIKR